MVHLMMTVWLMFYVNMPESTADRKSGPYNIVFEKFAECDDEGTREVIQDTKMYRTSDGRHIYNSSMYLGHPIDQHFKTYLELQSFNNGGYTPRFMHHTFKGCLEHWRYFKDIMSCLHLGDKYVEKCPIPAANYMLTGDISKEYVTNLKSMIYNKYRVILKYYYKETLVGCFNMYIEVVPKE